MNGLREAFDFALAACAVAAVASWLRGGKYHYVEGDELKQADNGSGTVVTPFHLGEGLDGDLVRTNGAGHADGDLVRTNGAGHTDGDPVRTNGAGHTDGDPVRAPTTAVGSEKLGRSGDGRHRGRSRGRRAS